MSRRSAVLGIAAVWLAVAVLFSLQNTLVGAARHRPLVWQWDVFHEFVYWLTWAAFTWPVLAATRRWGPGPDAGFRLGPHLAVMAVLAPLQITTALTAHWLLLASLGLAPAPTLAAWLGGLGAMVLWGTIMAVPYYWIIVGVRAAFVYQRLYQAQRVRAAGLEGALSRSQLEALRLQLNPHFLFNTLNAIGAFVGADPERARRMVARLGELLRRTLAGGPAEIPLERELDQLAPYIEIQRIRFGDRLRFVMDIDAAARAALVPNLLLQPLIENAVEHGASRRPGEATVRLGASAAAGRLHLEITDDGPGPDAADAGEGGGIGLANTRERLAVLYGERHRFELGPTAPAGTRVTIEIPLRMGA